MKAKKNKKNLSKKFTVEGVWAGRRACPPQPTPSLRHSTTPAAFPHIANFSEPSCPLFHAYVPSLF
jgi:hypothetical protein